MGNADEMELLYSLIGYPAETEWLEFKDSNSDPERIGKDISALANSAAFHGRDFAYKIWGVEDTTRQLVGTTFNPLTKKAKGNQDLSIWLRRFLSTNANYEFNTIERGGLKFVVLVVVAANGQPVYFDNAAYIREGSSTTRLVTGSAKEAELWRRLQTEDFESLPAEKDVAVGEIFELLDLDAYYGLLRTRRPGNIDETVNDLCRQELLSIQDNGRYTVTNLGALLVARRLGDFPGLRKRTLRVVRFEGDANFDILDDTFFDSGYALAFPQAEQFVSAMTSAKEVTEGAFRRVRTEYPRRAVRELLSNMVVHQDLSDTTAGPVVSIYSNRLEFSNPGTTLVPIDRLLNARPKTRNAALVRVLRQMDLCEEGGTGWDLIVASCEAAFMPAPKVTSEDGLGTVVTLFGGRAYDRMTKAERREAAYWHACLMYARGSSMNNQSLRARFGLEDEKKNLVAISRLIRECCEAGLIKGEDEEASAKFRRYIPAWA